jgi:copper chaperone CopZ
MVKQKLTVSLILTVYILIAISCGGNGQKSVKSEVKQESSSIEVSIVGMMCLGCEQTIEKNVTGLNGIKSVKASFTTGNAIIEYFPGLVDTSDIRKAINGSGYTVKKFIVSNMPEGGK